VPPTAIPVRSGTSSLSGALGSPQASGRNARRDLRGRPDERQQVDMVNVNIPVHTVRIYSALFIWHLTCYGQQPAGTDQNVNSLASLPPGEQDANQRPATTSSTAAAATSTQSRESRPPPQHTVANQSASNMSADKYPANLGQEMDAWRRTAPNSSYMRVPGSNYIIHKDNVGHVHLVLAPAPGSAPAAVLPPQGAYQHKDGTGQHVRQPLATNRPATFHHYAPSAQSSSASQNTTNRQPEVGQPGQSDPGLPFVHTVPVTPPKSTSSGSVNQISPRTPAEVDKKRLAKDLLRNLGFSSKIPGKRPLDGVSAEESDPKRRNLQAPADIVPHVEPDVGVLEAETADSSMSIGEHPKENNLSINPPHKITEQPLEAVVGSSPEDVDIPRVPIPPLPPRSPTPQSTGDTLLAAQGSDSAVSAIQAAATAIEPEPEVTPVVPPPLSLVQSPTPPSRKQVTASNGLAPKLAPSSRPITPTEVIEISDSESTPKMSSTSHPSERLVIPVLDLTASPPVKQQKPAARKEPLFLPSPASSPARMEVEDSTSDDEYPAESGTLAGKNAGQGVGSQKEHPQRKKLKAYVLVPPPTISKARHQERDTRSVSRQSSEGTP
jgi:hypothetical protein